MYPADRLVAFRIRFQPYTDSLQDREYKSLHPKQRMIHWDKSCKSLHSVSNRTQLHNLLDPGHSRCSNIRKDMECSKLHCNPNKYLGYSSNTVNCPTFLRTFRVDTQKDKQYHLRDKNIHLGMAGTEMPQLHS